MAVVWFPQGGNAFDFANAGDKPVHLPIGFRSAIGGIFAKATCSSCLTFMVGKLLTAKHQCEIWIIILTAYH
jgi:hypothetical protein